MSDQANRARQMVLAVELNEAELASRIQEAIMELKRPPGMTAAEALATQTEESRQDVRRAAASAVQYFHEQVNAGASVS